MVKKSWFGLFATLAFLPACTIPPTHSGESTQFCAASFYFVEIVENGDVGGPAPARCKQPARFSDGNSYKYENSIADAEREAAEDPATQGKIVVWGPREGDTPWCLGKKPTRYWIYEDMPVRDGCE